MEREREEVVKGVRDGLRRGKWREREEVVKGVRDGLRRGKWRERERRGGKEG